jgi:3-oxosteroid 1-dehydrogenase
MTAWDEEHDFVSIGGGIGGLVGALVAHEAGLAPLVIEKTSQIGGVAALSQGQLWVPGNHVAAGQFIADSATEGLAYMEWVGGGFAEKSHAGAYVRWAPSVTSFLMERAGVILRVWRGQPDYYYPVAPGSVVEGRCLEVVPFAGDRLGEWAPRTRTAGTHRVTNQERAHGADGALISDRARNDVRTQGGGLAAYLVRNAVDRGVALRTDTRAVRLVREDGRVVGVVVEDAAGEKHVRAHRGVLLATSGYDWSTEMVRGFDARTSPSSLTMPEITGDHLRMAGALGAKIVAPAVRPQYVDPRFQLAGTLERINTALPGVIMVNRQGARFADESFGPSFTAALSNVDVDEPRLANQPFWAVFDHSFRTSHPIGPITPHDELPDGVISAETPEQLARLIGVDEAGLVAELVRFNEDAAAGEDPRFGRGTRPITLIKGDRDNTHPTLGPLLKAPYYAVPLVTASIGIPVAGIAADTVGRTVDWEDCVIPGLYVAGNSMALHETGIGYQSGYANTRAAVFAALAACDAAGVDPSTLGLAPQVSRTPDGLGSDHIA